MTATTLRKNCMILLILLKKKVKAIYTLLENEIESNELEFDNSLKTELNKRINYYESGGKMISAEAAKKLINKTLQRHKAQ